MQNEVMQQGKGMFVGKIVFHKDYGYGQVTSEGGEFGERICIKFTGKERISYSCQELLQEGFFTNPYEIAELQKRAAKQKQAEEKQAKDAEMIKILQEKEKKRQEELENTIIAEQERKIAIEMKEKRDRQKEQEKRKQQKKYIENALKKPLTDEQCDAIFNDDDASLIVAGAGCGKTTTALGKIIYLVNSGKAKLEEILPIYFNNKNAEEMNGKITAVFGNTQKIAYDYHQLGLKILGGRQSCPVRKIDEVIRKIFNEIIENKRFDDFICRIFDFIMKYMYSNDESALEIFSSYFDDLSIEEKIEKLACDCITLDGKRVKSAAEAVIANFLFTHKIPYAYEKQFKSCYPNADVMTPDFYVPIGDGTDPKNAVWIEHWGIEFDSHGNELARWMNSKEEAEYIANKKAKLNTYKACDAKLIELFLSDFKNETLISKLKCQLEKFGIDTGNEMTRDEKIDCIKQLIKNRKFESFQEIVQRCISLLKINKYTAKDIPEIHKNALSGLEKREKERAKEFYRIVYVFMKEYERRQTEENFIDYTDMLIKALAKIDATEFSYKYIIIDEYQDIDDLNYDLISAIQKKTKAKICCVGDDWQAIYRFKGGNIRFFSDFEKYFPNPKTYRIQQTFRNGAPLIDVAGKFIQKNDNQLRKTIRSDKTTFLKAIRYHEFKTWGSEKDIDRLNCLFDILNQKDKDNFLIIIRNNSDFNKYFDYFGKNYSSVSGVEMALRRKFSKNIDIRTAHKSKGLEYDYVVVFNLAFRVTGFPSLLGDDPAISFLLPPEEDFPYSEERRLFYVALTRAKKGCYLLVPKFEPSVFFSEIKEDIVKNNIFDSNNALLATCPRCGKEMVHIWKKDETKEQFYNCSSYPRCKFSKAKAFLVKNTANVEEIIQSNIENRNRMASVYKYTNKFDIMDCKLVDNVADTCGISRKIDAYVVFDNFDDYSKIKNCLLKKEREPVSLNFSENDVPERFIKNVFGNL